MDPLEPSPLPEEEDSWTARISKEEIIKLPKSKFPTLEAAKAEALRIKKATIAPSSPTIKPPSEDDIFANPPIHPMARPIVDRMAGRSARPQGDFVRDPKNWPLIAGTVAAAGATGGLPVGAGLGMRALAGIVAPTAGTVAGKAAANVAQDQPVSQDLASTGAKDALLNTAFHGLGEVGAKVGSTIWDVAKGGKLFQKYTKNLEDIEKQLYERYAKFRSGKPAATKTQTGTGIENLNFAADEMQHNLGLTDDWMSTEGLTAAQGARQSALDAAAKAVEARKAAAEKATRYAQRPRPTDPKAAAQYDKELADLNRRSSDALLDEQYAQAGTSKFDSTIASEQANADAIFHRIKLSPREREEIAALRAHFNRNYPLDPQKNPGAAGIGPDLAQRASVFSNLTKLIKAEAGKGFDPTVTRIGKGKIEEVSQAYQLELLDELQKGGVLKLADNIDKYGKDTLENVFTSGLSSPKAKQKALEFLKEIEERGRAAKLAEANIESIVRTDEKLSRGVAAILLKTGLNLPMSTGVTSWVLKEALSFAFNHPNFGYFTGNTLKAVFKDMNLKRKFLLSTLQFYLDKNSEEQAQARRSEEMRISPPTEPDFKIVGVQ